MCQYFSLGSVGKATCSKGGQASARRAMAREDCGLLWASSPGSLGWGAVDRPWCPLRTTRFLGHLQECWAAEAEILGFLPSSTSDSLCLDSSWSLTAWLSATAVAQMSLAPWPSARAVVAMPVCVHSEPHLAQGLVPSDSTGGVSLLLKNPPHPIFLVREIQGSERCFLRVQRGLVVLVSGHRSCELRCR